MYTSVSFLHPLFLNTAVACGPATGLHTCIFLYLSTVDASRVILSVPDVDGSDYINASYIDVCMHLIVKSKLFNELSVGFRAQRLRAL